MCIRDRVDGVRRSTDGGDSWEKVNHGSIPNLDVHNVAVAGGPPRTVVVLVNDDVYTSQDGDTWTSLNVRQNFPYGYPRGVKVQPDDPQTIFLTVGDTTPGRVGAIMRSKDTGKTWEQLPLPVDPNTAMWVVNVQSFDPRVVLAGSRYGYLYLSLIHI